MLTYNYASANYFIHSGLFEEKSTLILETLLYTVGVLIMIYFQEFLSKLKRVLSYQFTYNF